MSYLLQDASFWAAVSFVIFVILVWWKARAIIRGAVYARIERIRSEIETAENLRDESKNILKDLSLKYEEAKAKAQNIIDQAHKDSKIIVNEAADKTAEFIQRRESQAEARIKQDEARAIRDIKNLVVDISINASSQILYDNRDSISGDLFDKSIENIQTVLQK